MDSSKKHTKVSPEEKAGVLSILFYWWFLPFLRFGYKKDISLKDVYNTTKVDLSGSLGDELQRNWKKELDDYNNKKKKKASLKNAIFKTFWKPFTLPGAALFFSLVVNRMLQPVVLAEFILFFDRQDEPRVGWTFGIGVVLMAFLNVIINHSTSLSTQRVGMRVRIAVCSLVYRKMLKLNHKSLGETAAGQLVNLLSNDVQRFDMVSMYLHYLWIMPINALVAFYVLYRYVGLIAAVTGMAFITLESIPLQGTFSKWQGILRYKIALKTDKRIKLMSEITSGIQVIKMYAWEKPFEKVVELARKHEIDVITVTSYCYGALSAMGIFTERLILYVTVITFVLVGNRLTGEVAFSLAQLFNNVQLIMAIFFPRALSLYSETMVSISRFEEFLMLEEIDVKTVENRIVAKINDAGEIKLRNVSASWTAKSIVPTLFHIDLHIKPGTLCCVVGNVGSGKSSLLQLLLNELPLANGNMSVSGSVSYACQEPWLFVSNVRENILFGKPFIKTREDEKFPSVSKLFYRKFQISREGTGTSSSLAVNVTIPPSLLTYIPVAYRKIVTLRTLPFGEDEKFPSVSKLFYRKFQISREGTGTSSSLAVNVTIPPSLLTYIPVAYRKIVTLRTLPFGYQDVVKVCSLERDFKQFAFGDKTMVGEKGTSLSGGQRARVNLARAVYAEADIYLFDDPLSAVDTKVGRHLFDECITKYLHGKTRILVTHQLQFMKKSDVIVIINNGKIEKVAKFNELTENELNRLHQEPESETESGTKINSMMEQFQSISSLASSTDSEDPKETDELIEKGAISNSTYLEYWRSGSSVFFLSFTLGMFFLSQIVTNASDLWLTHWTNVEGRRFIQSQLNDSSESGLLSNPTYFPVENETAIPVLSTISSLQTETTLPQNHTLLQFITSALPPLQNGTANELESLQPRTFFIWIYSLLILMSVILLTLRSFLYYKICMTASKVLHNTMFSNILQAPMRFFDTNPSGRILNRFSKDMGAVDEMLPRCQIDAIQIFCVMGGILVMVFIVTPWMILPTMVLAPLYYFYRVVYLKSGQSLKRLEGITRAPVFSHLSASLYGITTIRSCNAEEMVTREFDVLQDQHTSTWFLFLVSSTAFGFYLDVISSIFLAVVTFQFLLFRDENTLSGNVGLVISQCLILTGMVQYGVRQSAEVASNMISVERVLQYTKLDKEGPFESLPTKKPPIDWPNKGRITFKNTSLRYALDLPPVLKDLNVEVMSGEKIGIVGRTGAGKSTLIASLFRLAPIDGTIVVDGVDIADIGLNDLRLNISIIPQEPILFSSSLRYNLDPFEKHSDEVLWKALENVELKNAVSDLNQPVSEGGSNFSAGQRQLICLARAIVRNNKVLVMDEATANVDPQTDALIQKTIRERFKDCTVLTIAHRLNTIMDSDRVLVMDAGQAVEFDRPHLLLQNPEGYFSKMVEETGPVMEEKLKSVARKDYSTKTNLNNDATKSIIITDNKEEFLL